MALILEVQYPGGERALAVGYPWGILRIAFIPRGPEARYLDELEVDFTQGPPHPVKRVIAGPRRPTIRVVLDLDPVERDRWIEARESEGWELREADGRPNELWIVANETRAATELEAAGARIQRGP